MSKGERALALARAIPAEDAQVERLTERYLELRRQVFRDAVDTLIELGQIAADVHRRLGRAYAGWLARVGTTYGSARNYAALAGLAAEQPEIVQGWKELGPTKLYRIAFLPKPTRKKVLRPHLREDLTRATDAEFAQIVEPHFVRKRKVTPEMRAHGLYMKVQAWTEALRKSKVAGVVDSRRKADLLAGLDALERAIERIRRDLR